MVTGHLSVAFAARARWPRAELLALSVAAFMPDLADFILPRGDQCRTSCELFTHAFPAFVLLAIATTALSWAIWHRRITAMLSGVMVLLHIACDMVTGTKQFWVGGPAVGLGLYQREGADFLIEATMMVVAWAMLRRAQAPPRRAVHPLTLVLLIVAQATFDLWRFRVGGGLLPPIVTRWP